jgi:hypothetical protein
VRYCYGPAALIHVDHFASKLVAVPRAAIHQSKSDYHQARRDQSERGRDLKSAVLK